MQYVPLQEVDMLEFFVMLGGLVMAYLGITKKNATVAAVGVVVAFAMFGFWLPNFYAATGALFAGIGGEIVTWFKDAFDGAGG